MAGSPSGEGRGSKARRSCRLADCCRAVLLLFALLLSACSAPDLPASSPASDRFTVLLASGDARRAGSARTAAQAAYRQAAALHPLDPVPYLRLAELYLDWNRPQEGLTAAAAAERLGAPGRQVARLRTALYAQRRDWERVLLHGETALALQPTDAPTRHLVAQAHVALGHAGAAEQQYRALLATDPDDTEAAEPLGLLVALYDPEAAAAALQQVDTPFSQDLLAVLGDDASETAYRLARLGQTCLAHSRPALAALALQQALAVSPRYAEARALLGAALERLGRTEEAGAHLQAAVLLDPDSALTRLLLGLHHLGAEDAVAARPHLESAYDLDPANPALSVYLARLYAALGDYTAAELWIAEAVRLAPENTAVWDSVARYYLEQGAAGRESTGAAPTLLDAAETLALLAPEEAATEDRLGWAYFLAGQFGPSEEHIGRAIQLDPSVAVAHYHLAQVRAYTGRTLRARLSFMRALDLCTDPVLRTAIEESLAALR